MKQKGRPKKSEAEKRSIDLTISYNEHEISTLNNRAAQTKQRVAQFVREMSLREETLQVVSISSRESARRVRALIELFNKLYINSQKNLTSADDEKQTDYNYQNYFSSKMNDQLWSEINEHLRDLNAQFLGYADDNNQ